MHELGRTQVVVHGPTAHLVDQVLIDHVDLYPLDAALVDHQEVQLEVQALEPVLLEAVYHEEVRQDHHLAVPLVQDEINR